jgi:FtsZ-binding cell division protein ZapB
MNETAVVQTDLDRLAERVEKAASLVQQLREDRVRLERERDVLMDRLQDWERKLQGQEISAVMQEVTTLRREQRDWQTERREVAGKIEALLKKLERLES